MDTPTKTYKTKGGVEVIHKTYATGREMRDLQNVFLEKTKVSVSGAATSFKDIDASVANEYQDKVLEIFVVSVNGKTENVVDEILNLQSEESDEIIKEVNKVVDSKKSASGTSTP